MNTHKIAVLAWTTGASILLASGSADAALRAIRWCCYATTAMSVTAFIGMMLCCLYMDYCVIRQRVGLLSPTPVDDPIPLDCSPEI